MRLHRFIGKYNLLKREIVIKNGEVIKQIKNVLRLANKNRILLADGRGNEGEFEIISISKEEIICKKINDLPSIDPPKKVNLYLAILKKENFELAVQKAVEVGIFSITPIITERTIKTGLNQKRLEKIILEASEQCGRNVVPTIFPILDFETALKNGSAAEEKIIFHLENLPYKPKMYTDVASIFIGPEGGFTEKEIKTAKNSGYSVASLGTLTLRGETAAIVASYRVINNL